MQRPGSNGQSGPRAPRPVGRDREQGPEFGQTHNFSRSRACSVGPFFGKDQCVGNSTEVETCEDLPECDWGNHLRFISFIRELLVILQSLLRGPMIQQGTSRGFSLNTCPKDLWRVWLFGSMWTENKVELEVLICHYLHSKSIHDWHDQWVYSVVSRLIGWSPRAWPLGLF